VQLIDLGVGDTAMLRGRRGPVPTRFRCVTHGVG
jgi:hypothetical protein